MYRSGYRWPAVSHRNRVARGVARDEFGGSDFADREIGYGHRVDRCAGLIIFASDTIVGCGVGIKLIGREDLGAIGDGGAGELSDACGEAQCGAAEGNGADIPNAGGGIVEPLTCVGAVEHKARRQSVKHANMGRGVGACVGERYGVDDGVADFRCGGTDRFAERQIGHLSLYGGADGNIGRWVGLVACCDAGAVGDGAREVGDGRGDGERCAHVDAERAYCPHTAGADVAAL